MDEKREVEQAPIPMRLNCPGCYWLHVDHGEYATKPHKTHACQHCGNTWTPAAVPTVGVRFLPGHKDEIANTPEDLREVLLAFARELVDESFDSSDYDHVNNAVDRCKRDLGERLLRLLGEVAPSPRREVAP